MMFGGGGWIGRLLLTTEFPNQYAVGLCCLLPFPLALRIFNFFLKSGIALTAPTKQRLAIFYKRWAGKTQLWSSTDWVSSAVHQWEGAFPVPSQAAGRRCCCCSLPVAWAQLPVSAELQDVPTPLAGKGREKWQFADALPQCSFPWAGSCTCSAAGEQGAGESSSGIAVCL